MKAILCCAALAAVLPAQPDTQIVPLGGGCGPMGEIGVVRYETTNAVGVGILGQPLLYHLYVVMVGAKPNPVQLTCGCVLATEPLWAQVTLGGTAFQYPPELSGFDITVQMAMGLEDPTTPLPFQIMPIHGACAEVGGYWLSDAYRVKLP